MSYKFEPCASSSPVEDSFEKTTRTIEEAADIFCEMFGDTYDIKSTCIDYGDNFIQVGVPEISDDMTRHSSFMDFEIRWCIDNVSVLTDEEQGFLAALISNTSFGRNQEFNNILHSLIIKLGIEEAFNSGKDFTSPFTDEFRVEKPEEFLKYMGELLES